MTGGGNTMESDAKYVILVLAADIAVFLFRFYR